jgi:hypothetical protein
MNAMPPLVRFIVTVLIAIPGRLACWAGLAFGLFFAMNMIYGERPIDPARPGQLAAAIGIAVTGCSMVVFAAVLNRKPDDFSTPRRAATLAALGMMNEALFELSALLIVGAFLAYSYGIRSAALHMSMGFLAAFFVQWGIHRMEEREEQRRRQALAEMPPQEG